jgi:hypothetical protein
VCHCEPKRANVKQAAELSSSLRLEGSVVSMPAFGSIFPERQCMGFRWE